MIKNLRLTPKQSVRSTNLHLLNSAILGRLFVVLSRPVLGDLINNLLDDVVDNVLRSLRSVIAGAILGRLSVVLARSVLVNVLDDDDDD